MAKKTQTKAEMEREIHTLRAWQLLVQLKEFTGRPGFEPGALRVVWGGPYGDASSNTSILVEASWYGWRRASRGVIEIVIHYLDTSTNPLGVEHVAPSIEVWHYGDLADAIGAFRSYTADATYTAPWASALRTLVSDVLSAANKAEEDGKPIQFTRDCGGIHGSRVLADAMRKVIDHRQPS